MAPKKLAAELALVVQGCVCHVGVDLNSASAELLRHVAGLTAARAAAVLSSRPAGGYASRKELQKVNEPYKILFHFKALLWESIILFIPPPAKPTLLQYCCTVIAQYNNICPPQRPSPFMPYTIQYW